LAGDHDHDARWDGGRIFGFTVIFVMFGIAVLFGALAYFGSSADGEPAASIELSAATREAWFS
jgi:hypothetical protein